MAEKINFNVNSYGAKAEEDMLNASAMLTHRLGTPRGCIFWCEQAIEKYFKHLLVQDGDSENLANRHKLLPLANKTGFKASTEERYLLGELSRMYYERYPSDDIEEIPEDPTWDDANTAYTFALRVQKWTYGIISQRQRNSRSSLEQLDLG